ncbi:Predicted arabinose efflux permease, MFS family [Roseomonas rosea]|uniref:Predicted arabinose efflux permease, MFS family n=1 Tax=Muricoccus roseus TaxID=198092 RepID=A0A1M6BWG0_9PROT|nr:YbfB/YjiJ family MFS transporter [Roseomonas rosea]SHI53001.1 Predicted arabinose efflux permease, MFS family [Roseomonas rosea]
MTARAPPAAALAGGAALCTTIGLARFGYVPLFPALVAAGWVGGGEAGALGATTFAGHLIGALSAPFLGARLGTRRALDLTMALATLSFLACAVPLGFAWLAPWRCVAGVAGGVAISLAGPAVQAVTPDGRRGAAGGIVIAGVGGGVIAASLLLPLLLSGGVAAAWLGLGLLSAALWAFAHPRWPDPPAPPPAAAGPTGPAGPVGAVTLAYAFSAAGMTPPMVYLADLAVRGRGMGLAAGGLVWALFGLGAVAGTLGGGRLADRLGRWAMPLWLGVQVAALGAALLPHPAAIPLAALLSGFSGVGISAVTLGRLRGLTGPGTGKAWARATAVYAAAQAATGYALAWLFAATGNAHAPVFLAGLVLSAMGLAVAIRRG